MVKQYQLFDINFRVNLKDKKIEFNQQKYFDIIIDNKNNKKFRIYLYKGEPIASRELTETDKSDKLRLVRLKAEFMNIKNEIEVTKYLIATEIINDIDIDIKLLEGFFKLYVKRSILLRWFNKLIEVYDVVKPNTLIGDIDLEYDLYMKFVKFLNFVVKESMKRDDFI